MKRSKGITEFAGGKPPTGLQDKLVPFSLSGAGTSCRRNSFGDALCQAGRSTAERFLTLSSLLAACIWLTACAAPQSSLGGLQPDAVEPSASSLSVPGHAVLAMRRDRVSPTLDRVVAVLSNETHKPGENRVTFDITREPVLGQSAGSDRKSPSEEERLDQAMREFPGAEISFNPVVRHSPTGPYLHVVGRYRDLTTCVLAWQPRDVQSFPLPRGIAAFSYEIRLCGRGKQTGDILRIIDTMPSPSVALFSRQS